MAFNVNFFALSAALVLSSSLQALPNGSPICAINDAQIAASPKQKSDSSLGYALKVNYAGSNSWDITITNGAGQRNFEGILLYVHQVNQPQRHLGQFSFQDQTKWKYMSEQICSSQSVISSTPRATVTQAKRDAVLISPSLVFRWTASPQELAMNGLVAHAAVATTIQGRPKWEHLKFYGIAPIPINGAASAANSTAAAATSNSTAAAPLTASGPMASNITAPNSTSVPTESSNSNSTSTSAASEATSTSTHSGSDQLQQMSSLLLTTLLFFAGLF